MKESVSQRDSLVGGLLEEAVDRRGLVSKGVSDLIRSRSALRDAHVGAVSGLVQAIEYGEGLKGEAFLDVLSEQPELWGLRHYESSSPSSLGEGPIGGAGGQRHVATRVSATSSVDPNS